MSEPVPWYRPPAPTPPEPPPRSTKPPPLRPQPPAPPLSPPPPAIPAHGQTGSSTRSHSNSDPSHMRTTATSPRSSLQDSPPRRSYTGSTDSRFSASSTSPSTSSSIYSNSLQRHVRKPQTPDINTLPRHRILRPKQKQCKLRGVSRTSPDWKQSHDRRSSGDTDEERLTGHIVNVKGGNVTSTQRWFKFDSGFLCVYKSEKDATTDWFLSLNSVTSVTKGYGNKPTVKVTVRGSKTLTLTAETTECRDALKVALEKPRPSSPRSSDTWGRLLMSGPLMVSARGLSAYGVLHSLCFHLYHSEQDADVGIGWFFCDTRTMSVKKEPATMTFSITTPQGAHRFVAHLESERDAWISKLGEASDEAAGSRKPFTALSWLPGNDTCADCKAPGPSWASVNLAVIVCTDCSVAHASLGQTGSRIYSLTVDDSVWTDDLIEMLSVLNNEVSNSFWGAQVPPSEALSDESTPADRSRFVLDKYWAGKYRKVHCLYGGTRELEQALLQSVRSGDLLESLSLVFSGARPTPAVYAAALCSGQKVQAQFIDQNLNTELPLLVPVSPRVSINISGHLYKTRSSAKPIDKRKGKDDFLQRWCTLHESALRYYYPESPLSSPLKHIPCGDIASVNLDSEIQHGFAHTMQIHVSGDPSEKLYLFADNDGDNLRHWARGLVSEAVDPWAKSLTCGPWDRVSHVGRATVGGGPRGGLPMDAAANAEGAPCWESPDFVPAWMQLRDSSLLLVLKPDRAGGPEGVYRGATGGAGSGDSGGNVPTVDSEEEEPIVINLKKLHELRVNSVGCRPKHHTSVILRDSKWSLCLRLPGLSGPARASSLVRSALGGRGRPLSQQPITDDDVVLAIARCLQFVESSGLSQEGLYRHCGVKSQVECLVDKLWADPRSAPLVPGLTSLNDVTSAIKTMLRLSPVAMLPSGSEWATLADDSDPRARAVKYGERISALPTAHRNTLQRLLLHLHRVHLASAKNRMPVENLVTIFNPVLFHTDLLDKSTISILRDLIELYPKIFPDDRV